MKRGGHPTGEKEELKGFRWQKRSVKEELTFPRCQWCPKQTMTWSMWENWCAAIETGGWGWRSSRRGRLVGRNPPPPPPPSSGVWLYGYDVNLASRLSSWNSTRFMGLHYKRDTDGRNRVCRELSCFVVKIWIRTHLDLIFFWAGGHQFRHPLSYLGKRGDKWWPESVLRHVNAA